jgi:ribonuclease E
MTFTEAAIEVLRREGKPLHFKKIAEIAIRENLLDHVGKVPEDTMADQLAAHCRQPRTERRVMAVQPGTFALSEWGLEEDPAGLEGLVEVPVEDELLYRGRERHPVPSRDMARSAGRGEGGRARRRDEEERRGRRFPPPAEVAYEILAGAGKPLALAEIAAQGAERLLMPDAFVRDAGSLQAALTEDNRRRESSGRKPLFQLDGETVTLVAQPEPGERPAPAAPRAPSTTAEIRRAALATLRRRLRECDGPTVEHVAGKLLEKLGFKDLKVAKRGREHVVYTGKRRMGLTEVRHGIRIARGGADAGRREVSDLRRDLAHYGAQLGVVISAGEAARDARGEAAAAGQLPIMLLCGEAFAEALADAGVGCVPIVVPDVDEAFFRAAAEAAEREESARRTRREERDKRERREPREPRPGAERPAEPASGETITVDAVSPAVPAPEEERRAEEAAASDEATGPAEADDLADDEGEEEGPEAEGAAAEGGAEGAGEGAQGEGGAAGERRRRRRRRRRRGGRGRGREAAAGGAPGTGGQAQAAAGGQGGGDAPAPAAREPERAPATPPEAPPPQSPSGGGEGGSSS